MYTRTGCMDDEPVAHLGRKWGAREAEEFSVSVGAG